MRSVDFYNSWFMDFAPKAFRETRTRTAVRVEDALSVTGNLLNTSVDTLKNNPWVLPILRMATCPPIARDRLIGLAGVSANLVGCMEDPEQPRIPPRMGPVELNGQLQKISDTLKKMADPDIFVWLRDKREGTEQEIKRAATIVADRLCGAFSDPIIRNAQEKRQLASIKDFLERKGYRYIEVGTGNRFNQMEPGSFSFRTNIPVKIMAEDTDGITVNIPVDVVIMPKDAEPGSFPILFEAKSAGDFTNVNKRRKEEAQKMQQLRSTYGRGIQFNLFLCGYFDSGYLGYEAAEGIDWVWEHRIEDLNRFGL